MHVQPWTAPSPTPADMLATQPPRTIATPPTSPNVYAPWLAGWARQGKGKGKVTLPTPHHPIPSHPHTTSTHHIPRRDAAQRSTGQRNHPAFRNPPLPFPKQGINHEKWVRGCGKPDSDKTMGVHVYTRIGMTHARTQGCCTHTIPPEQRE